MNKKIIVILVSIIVVFGSFYFWKGLQVQNTVINSNKVTFICDNAKDIRATFYPDDDKAVDLVLSDGRTLSVPHAISASGARYANADETFVFWNKGNTAFITEGKNSEMTYANCVVLQDPVTEDDISCYKSENYFVVEKSLVPEVGTDILVKYKKNPSQDISCKYVVENGDFEIKNAEAQYFLAFTDNFLLLDSGTAPEPRGLVVYDLRNQKKVFTDSYAKPVDVTGDSISYLSKTNIKATNQNCSDLKTYTSNGLGAVIMSKVTVNLLTLSKKDIGVTQCLSTQ